MVLNSKLVMERRKDLTLFRVTKFSGKVMSL